MTDLVEEFRLWLRRWLGVDGDQHQLFIELRETETRLEKRVASVESAQSIATSKAFLNGVRTDILESQMTDILRDRAEDAKRPEPRKRIVTKTMSDFREAMQEEQIHVP